MVAQPRKFKPQSNLDLLSKMYDGMSMSYQNRITSPTVAGVEGTLKQLTNGDNRPAANEFVSALFNRIGRVVQHYDTFNNPFVEFKLATLTYGDVIEEVQTGLIESRPYDPDREVLEGDLFGTARVPTKTALHKVNRADSYKVTINEPLLHRAFLDDQGLSNFISGLMAAPTTSDNWDEFLLTCSLFGSYESNGGFFKVQVPDVAASGATEADAKDALKKLRAMADNLAFLSTKYNAAHMPVSATADELLIFVTPEFKATIDVDAFAAMFNLEHGQMHGRVIPIPSQHFGIDGVQAIMTTTRFFMMADTVMETRSLENPGNLQSNHWLHHHQIISASPFAPAVMFTTHRGTDDVIVIDAPASISNIVMTDIEGTVVAANAVTRGSIYGVESLVTYDSGAVKPAVRWKLEGNTDFRTVVTQNGALHISGTEGATTLTLTAISTFKDPEDLMADGIKKTRTLTVGGEFIIDWPRANTDVAPKATGITVAGVAVAAFVDTTLTYSVVAPDWTGDAKQIVVEGVDNSNVTVKLNAAKTVATISVPGAPGDPVYTVTVATA